MATELKNKRLYCVRFDEHFISSGIEAANAQEAIATATKSLGQRDVLDVSCDKIYKTNIGIELNDAEKSDGVYDIEIRGTDPARVDALKRALAILIGGPRLDDEDQDRVGEVRQLRTELDENGYMVTSI